MSFNYRYKKSDASSMRTHEAGFSMVELIMVCVVLVIVTGIAVPNIFRTYQNYQLDSAGHSVASLLQQTRIQAVKTNVPAYANFTNAASGNIAFVSNDNSAAYAAGDPDVELSPAVSFQNAPPEHSQLDTYLSGGAPGLTSQVGGSIGFNARGLPCSETTPGGNPTVCSFPGGASGYIWFMQNNIGWEAVTVTPSGRIKSWRLNSQAAAPFTWQ
jgi:Tfp pilus assembly protein FimT